MIFNSYIFILIYLPVVLIGFSLLIKFDKEQTLIWFLALASLAFYAAWNINYLPLLLVSICANFACSQLILRNDGNTRLILLWAGIFLNLFMLGYFKYANFFLETTSYFTGGGFSSLKIILPLAISFFTFQQIAYLVDTHAGLCDERNFGRYLLFVSFFPQLIAGPIVHHKEMMPQFTLQSKRFQLEEKRVQGIIFFVLGLAKKVLIADSLAPYSIALFDSDSSIGFAEAWSGTLAYTFQLYFDFSGYTDMAIGIALLFGIRLPDNFDSPYKSRSIIEFWRRWHITLSRFLRDYLYFALGGNRKGSGRRYANLVITMLLGGLWHGAAWTFVIWGGLHGLLLVINHGWHFFLRKMSLTSLRNSAVYGVVAWGLTFFVVHNCWVVFRATNGERAVQIYRAMYSPELSFSQQAIDGDMWMLLSFSAVVAFFLPNVKRSVEIVLSARCLNREGLGGTLASFLVGGGFACLAALIITRLNSFSEFLYFQF